MEQLAAIMLLITCSDDLAVCKERPTPTISYETVATCETELRPALRNLAGESPKVFGKCVEVDPEIMERDAAILWEIDANNELKVTIREEHETEEPTIMGTKSPETRGKPRQKLRNYAFRSHGISIQRPS
ncbi:hypothetical protein DUT91_10660 [Phyllobacterium salinisoli]|uniref:Uncharacterized protein n=1 Tax=Phyllobacterium salinisoli TaxID=1899321 RepID=A0A368K2X3_9HYPH|nr:hypothetical protein [Phyllobacterium salinisoli]RCS23739.1 hypothetical protein DUT91_10660 [Phyllobacterium salinisoli]